MRVEGRLLGCLAAGIFLTMAGAVSYAGTTITLPENPLGGSSVFVAKKCLRCHAIQGSGGTRGPDLGRFQLPGGFLGMAGIMWNHAPKMITSLAKDNIPFPQFTTKEMTQLVSFLYALNYFDRPGDPRRGEEIFGAKKCQSCHSVGGKGGSVGPPLDAYGRFISPLFIANGLWNKGVAMAEAMRRANISRPALSGRDVQDIVAFIRARAFRAQGKTSRVFIHPGNPKNGASLFQSKGCAACHAEKNGKAGAGPPLVYSRFKVSLSAIASRMWNHGPGMWSMWRVKGMGPISLTVEEMADITAYLYFLQFDSPPGEPARGAILFRSLACADCHKSTESKKKLGPDLRTKGPWKSDLDLVREMWNHAGKMHGKIVSTRFPWPRMSEKEVADLLKYVRSIGGTRKEKEAKK